MQVVPLAKTKKSKGEQCRQLDVSKTTTLRATDNPPYYIDRLTPYTLVDEREDVTQHQLPVSPEDIHLAPESHFSNGPRSPHKLLYSTRKLSGVAE